MKERPNNKGKPYLNRIQEFEAIINHEAFVNCIFLDSIKCNNSPAVMMAKSSARINHTAWLELKLRVYVAHILVYQIIFCCFVEFSRTSRYFSTIYSVYTYIYINYNYSTKCFLRNHRTVMLLQTYSNVCMQIK